MHYEQNVSSLLLCLNNVVRAYMYIVNHGLCIMWKVSITNLPPYGASYSVTLHYCIVLPLLAEQ